jgi:hypothetical protein
VGVPAHDDVGPRVDELLRQLLLPGQRARVALLAPVQVHDDGVGDVARPPHLLDQAVGALGGRHAGCVATGGPGVDELPVQHLRGAEDGDALPLHLDDVRCVRAGLVLTQADERQAGRASGLERVRQALTTEVQAVVVGQADDVHPRVAERRQGRRGRPEGELLVRRGAAVGHRRLEVHDGQVGAAQRVPDARQAGPDRITGRTLGVHVAGEGERHRLRLVLRRGRRRGLRRAGHGR